MTRLFYCLAAMLAFSFAAAAAESKLVVTTDPHSEPESVTVAPDAAALTAERHPVAPIGTPWRTVREVFR
jgi:hypothetical protein